MIRYGYCCINQQLSSQGIRTGRAMIDRKFKLGGLQLASDIALANAKDLLTASTLIESNSASVISPSFIISFNAL
jgi:hypothetical protein